MVVKVKVKVKRALPVVSPAYRGRGLHRRCAAGVACGRPSTVLPSRGRSPTADGVAGSIGTSGFRTSGSNSKLKMICIL